MSVKRVFTKEEVRVEDHESVKYYHLHLFLYHF